MRPKVAVVSTLPGLLKCAWLNRLKASTRSWMRRLPPKSMFLKSDRSVEAKPGPRIVLRPALPGRAPVAASGRETKDDVFEHWALRCGGSRFGSHVPSGRVGRE